MKPPPVFQDDKAQHMYFKFHRDFGHMPSTPIKEPTEAHLSIVGQRWPLEARPTSPASLLDRFFFYDAGGEPMSSRWSSWPACAGMTSVGSASCSCCPQVATQQVRATRRAGTAPNPSHTSSEACPIPCSWAHRWSAPFLSTLL